MTDAMAQTQSRDELTESEQRNLPMVVPQPNERRETWLMHVMRILFGWKTAATRADFEQVLTDKQPHSGFSPEEAAMLKNILSLRECRIENVMLPRADIIAVQQDISIGELLNVFERAAHSRLVVYNDTLDDPTGMVHIRDLIVFMVFASQKPAGSSEQPAPAVLDLTKIDLALPLAAAKIVREILYAPPSMPALDLLAKMQATRIHLALVIDEYGGTDGLVSMEDLVELIVGDIADEHDEAEMPAVTAENDGTFLATGRASLDEVRAAIGDGFDIGEAAHEVDTLGGYLVLKAGHVPVRGELVPCPAPFEAEVLDADPRRVKRVRIYRRNERRPGAVRDVPNVVKTAVSAPVPSAPSPAPSRDEDNRPTQNSVRSS